jgi:hypothetical protein
MSIGLALIQRLPSHVIEAAVDWCAKTSSIESNDLPFVSGMAKMQTTRQKRLEVSKKRYSPKEERARRIGAVKITVQFPHQFALCAAHSRTRRLDFRGIDFEHNGPGCAKE